MEIVLFDGRLPRLTTRGVVYGGVMSTPGPAGERALDVLLEAYVEDAGFRLLFTEIRNLSNTSSIQPLLRNHNLNFEAHLNYLIALDKPPDQIMESMAYNARKQIRRGMSRGTPMVEEVVSKEGLARYYELLRQTYAVARVPLADRSLPDAPVDELLRKEMIRFVLTRVDDLYIATSVDLLYKDIVYGWFGGGIRKLSRYTPNEIIT